MEFVRLVLAILLEILVCCATNNGADRKSKSAPFNEAELVKYINLMKMYTNEKTAGRSPQPHTATKTVRNKYGKYAKILKPESSEYIFPEQQRSGGTVALVNPTSGDDSLDEALKNDTIKRTLRLPWFQKRAKDSGSELDFESGAKMSELQDIQEGGSKQPSLQISEVFRNIFGSQLPENFQESEPDENALLSRDSMTSPAEEPQLTMRPEQITPSSIRQTTTTTTTSTTTTTTTPARVTTSTAVTESNESHAEEPPPFFCFICNDCFNVTEETKTCKTTRGCVKMIVHTTKTIVKRGCYNGKVKGQKISFGEYCVREFNRFRCSSCLLCGEDKCNGNVEDVNNVIITRSVQTEEVANPAHANASKFFYLFLVIVNKKLFM